MWTAADTPRRIDCLSDMRVPLPQSLATNQKLKPILGHLEPKCGRWIFSDEACEPKPSKLDTCIEKPKQTYQNKNGLVSVSSIQHCLTRNTQILKAGANETTKIHRLRSSQYKLYPLVRKKEFTFLFWRSCRVTGTSWSKDLSSSIRLGHTDIDHPWLFPSSEAAKIRYERDIKHSEEVSPN